MRRTDRRNRKRGIAGMLVIAAVLAAVIAAVLLFGDKLTGFLADMEGQSSCPVAFSELGIANDSIPNEYGVCCDYVELINTADHSVDISGWGLTDGGRNNLYQFPEGTVLAPGELTLVWCSKDLEGPDIAPFGLARAGGETVRLLDAREDVLLSVETVAVEPDEALEMAEDGTLRVALRPSPGEPNPATEEKLSIRLSEVMTGNTAFPDAGGAFPDWVELENTGAAAADLAGCTLSDDSGEAKYIFPAETVLESGAFLVRTCEAEGETGFALTRAGGELLTLKDRSGRVLDRLTTVPLENDESYALMGGEWVVCDAPTPGYANTDDGAEAMVRARAESLPQVYISEVMLSNSVTLPDGKGNFADYLELVNDGREEADLTGWYLSDDPEEPFAWRLPKTVLRPDQRLVLFCGGEDGPDFSLTNGETLVLTDPAGTEADRVTLPEAADDEAFVRASKAEAGTLGTPAPGYPKTEAGAEAFALSRKTPALALWEVMNANDAYLKQPNGLCYDWVELKNTTDEPMDLTGYTLSDDADKPGAPLPEKTLGAGQRLTVLLSGQTKEGNTPQLALKLSANGDKLYLRDAQGKLIDYLSVPLLPYRTSYGRMDGAEGFFYMDPTPGKENAEGQREVTDLPEGSLAEGVAVVDRPVALSFISPGEVRYTLDGSVPDENDELYTTPLTIEKNTVVRAVAMEEGKHASEPYTVTVLVGVEHDLPVVCVTASPADLFGSDGIYKWYTAVKEIEKPGHVAYAGEDGAFSLDCGLKLHGCTSIVNKDKKSFAVKLRGVYDGMLDFDLFGDGKITSFGSFLLRADQEGQYASYIRDNVLGRIGTDYGGGMAAQNTRQVAMYLNGEYWGLYSLREQYTIEYVSTHLGVPEDTVMVTKNTGRGTLREVTSLCAGGRLSDEEYARVCECIDPEAFADWIVFESYCGNIDVIGNTRYLYTSADGKWRPALVDCDLGFFSHQTYSSVTYGSDFGTLTSGLLKTPAFRTLFLERASFLLNGPLSDAAVVAAMDALADGMRSEIPADTARWEGTPQAWERQLESLKNYADGRAEEMVDGMRTAIRLTSEERTQYFPNIP